MLPASVLGEGEFPAAALGSLASEEYKDRVQAQRDLIAWAQEKPENAGNRLLQEHDATGDPEVRLRLREALKEVVVSEYQRKEGKGYVGIQMDERNVALPGNDEQRGGVWVTWVHPDTPAAKAGLQVNDVVVALNDIKWPAGMGARESFATEIRRHKPGDKVKLEVLRGAEVMKLEMTLAARPMGLDQAMRLFLLPGAGGEDPVEDLKVLEKQAKDDYFDRWLAEKRAAAKKP
ncbi:PDZ domain-containing protein [Luteolibacter arcticus]|uniref:PDZ domain-containing protein n=1 Tax=Luteolibacter arcticus TaxID=1581411 RepID=A0ABT3GMZ8_9BACT|nr:PDZ domain-containing protein [Luteolibacter arcticus]MCW1924845.1 PDZ domain-containing protein [Luteolibacter arcticus]